MVFEGSDGALCGVASVDVWWHKLESDVFFVEELFKYFRGFVV